MLLCQGLFSLSQNLEDILRSQFLLPKGSLFEEKQKFGFFLLNQWKEIQTRQRYLCFLMLILDWRRHPGWFWIISQRKRLFDSERIWSKGVHCGWKRGRSEYVVAHWSAQWNEKDGSVEAIETAFWYDLKCSSSMFSCLFTFSLAVIFWNVSTFPLIVSYDWMLMKSGVQTTNAQFNSNIVICLRTKFKWPHEEAAARQSQQ